LVCAFGSRTTQAARRRQPLTKFPAPLNLGEAIINPGVI
jgi:hypothetical protein